MRDLLFHLPRRYDDLRALSTAAQLARLPDGEGASARLQVRGVRVEQTFRRRIQRTTAYLADDTGDVEAVWFGRRFIATRLKEGQSVVVSGKIKRRGFATILDNPEFQPDDGSALLHAGRIVPVYRLTGGVTATVLRRAIRQALDSVGRSYPEYLPPAASGDGERPVPIAEALESAHYPDDFDRRDAALRRLGFDELLALQIGMVSRDRQRRLAVGEPVAVAPARVSEAEGLVEGVITEQIRARGATDPARLTPDQVSAVERIVADLAQSRPMMRLLQGDVGSGKTAVAALALAFVADAGRQGALLAPTDLLARQHAAALDRLLKPLGHGVTLLTGSLPAAERRQALELIAAPPAGMGLDSSSGRVDRRHARPGAGRRPIRRPGAGRRRRAAPFRRRPARGAGHQGPLAPRAADDRHPDPAQPGPDHAVGPGRFGPAHAARRAAAYRDRHPAKPTTWPGRRTSRRGAPTR